MTEELIDLATLIADKLAARMESRFAVQPTLTLAQAAEAMDLSQEKVRQLCQSGQIPFVRVDKFYRIKPGDINEWLEQHYQPAKRARRKGADHGTN